MTREDDSGTSNRRPVSAVSAAFLDNDSFLKRFLAQFFSSRQDIEDVAQEAYLRAYVAEQRKEIEQPKAYLFRIARNVALTKLTRKSEKITDYLEECGASVVMEYAAGADSEVESQQAFGLYCEAVASLPEKCRQVFLLRKVHGLAHKEIAERMSLSLSSVEKYLHRGILECKAFVQEHESRAHRQEASRAAEGGRVKGR
ncbi:MAG: sigma-70 family RNA polymerase sigma factor [Desulfobulbaceae bacterium]|nr:sigma-70 family RNA polymerase sigma factor [Desulfobulbaceae bacterium]